MKNKELIKEKLKKIQLSCKYNLSQNLSLDRLVRLIIVEIDPKEWLVDYASGYYNFNSFVNIFEEYNNEHNSKLSEDQIYGFIEYVYDQLNLMNNNDKLSFLENIILNGSYSIEEYLK